MRCRRGCARTTETCTLAFTAVCLGNESMLDGCVISMGIFVLVGCCGRMAFSGQRVGSMGPKDVSARRVHRGARHDASVINRSITAGPERDPTFRLQTTIISFYCQGHHTALDRNCAARGVFLGAPTLLHIVDCHTACRPQPLQAFVDRSLPLDLVAPRMGWRHGQVRRGLPPCERVEWIV